ncbi:MAG: glycosyltransferase family 39 protein [Candidatus Hydrogenedentes bacterium]|nr:glycosyltransferase family 39 protein [Candidatus Hydrogenedentota bacterium]
MKKTGHLPVLIGFAAVVFLVNLWGYDLWPADEPRYAEVAREMMDSGDYLVPRVNGLPYREKPPLLFWAIAAASLPFGDVTALSARLPSVVAALVTLLCTYLLAARLYGRRVAFWAALILTTSTRFWWQARTAQIDMILTACLSVALLAFWHWHQERRTGWLVAFYAAMAAAVYAKGPVGVIFPALMVLAFYWRRKEERRGLHLLWGIAAVALLIAAWLVPARMAASAGSATALQSDVAANLFRQTIGRFFLGVSKAQWPWYYLGTLPIDWMPWTLFLPWAIPWVWKRRKEGPEMRLLLSWTVPAFLFFSACAGKRAIYLLPLFPALSILFSRSILDLAANARAGWRRWTAAAWAAVLLALAAAPFALLFTEYRDAWTNSFLVLVACAAACALHAAYRALRPAPGALHKAMAAHFVLLATAGALIAFPVVNRFKSARDFCEPVRAIAESGADFNLYSLAFSREEYIFYSKHFHTPVLTDESAVADGSPEVLANAGLVKAIRKAVANAVEQVPVSALDALTDAELDALQAAVDEAMAGAGIDQEALRQLRPLLAEASGAFAATFAAGDPAYLYVQERDWRWMLLLHPEIRDCPVIRNEMVGSRRVVLVTNAAGAALLAQAGAVWPSSAPTTGDV